MKPKYYVGLKIGKAVHERELFTSVETPTPESHGTKYVCVIGPFRTKMGAVFMRDYGRNNPHCQTVADAERLAKKGD